MDSLKQCNKCGEWKPATREFFFANKSYRDGLQSDCKVCHQATTKKWLAANPEKARESRKRWYQNNLKKYQDWCKQYRADNADRRREYDKQWRNRNSEKRKQYYEANREKMKNTNQLRRARKRKASGTHTAEDIKLIYDNQRGKCWWCGCEVGDDYHVDHRIPLIRGGSDAPDNLVISCPACNCSKKGRLPHEWNGRLL